MSDRAAPTIEPAALQVERVGLLRTAAVPRRVDVRHGFNRS